MPEGVGATAAQTRQSLPDRRQFGRICRPRSPGPLLAAPAIRSDDHQDSRVVAPECTALAADVLAASVVPVRVSAASSRRATPDSAARHARRARRAAADRVARECCCQRAAAMAPGTRRQRVRVSPGQRAGWPQGSENCRFRIGGCSVRILHSPRRCHGSHALANLPPEPGQRFGFLHASPAKAHVPADALKDEAR